jgi:hypothetical protein
VLDPLLKRKKYCVAPADALHLKLVVALKTYPLGETGFGPGGGTTVMLFDALHAPIPVAFRGRIAH